MGLVQLIDDYEDMKRLLRAAIQADSNSEVSKMDKVVDGCFDKILVYKPNDEAELKLLAEFLVGTVASNSEDGLLFKRAKDRILELVIGAKT
ncbi:MAG: hypothetical protein AAGA76_09805 [Pseudomonadota bacterium]